MIITTTALANPQIHRRNTAFPPRNKLQQRECDEGGDDDYVGGIGGGGGDAVAVLVLSETLFPSLEVRTDRQFPPPTVR